MANENNNSNGNNNSEEDDSQTSSAILAFVIILITLAITFIMFQSMTEDEEHEGKLQNTSQPKELLHP